MSHPVHKDYGGAKLGMWLFLYTEVLLFSGLFLLYSVYLSYYPVQFASSGAQLDTVLGTINTVVLLTSSLFVAMAVTAIQNDHRQRVIILLAGTILCAITFLGIKYLEWTAKFEHEIYPGSERLAAAPPGESIFFGLYYLITGLHGVHVLIGALLLTWVAFRVHRGLLHAGDDIWLENSALYWHLVDLIWIFIFPLYYLIF